MTKLAFPINRKVKYDEASSTVSYIGEATFGALDSDPIWRIRRMTLTGNNFVIDWANSNAEFNHVWNDRASLSYG